MGSPVAKDLIMRGDAVCATFTLPAGAQVEKAELVIDGYRELLIVNLENSPDCWQFSHCKGQINIDPCWLKNWCKGRHSYSVRVTYCVGVNDACPHVVLKGNILKTEDYNYV